MTSHHHALARLAGRPLAMAPRVLDTLLSAAGLSIVLPRSAEPDYQVTASGIAVVPVIGPLVARGDWVTALFGAMSYGEVVAMVEAAFADPGTKAVLLEIDSPGGEVGGLFDAVDRIAALRDAHAKPLWAMASESALSAAYAIASAAQRIYVSRTAETGSVGVVAIHVDESGANAMAGQRWTLVHAGAKKVDGNPHEPLSPQALADIQADVDALHDELVVLVARNRNLDPDAVRATEAAIYRGRRGIAAGFADRLGTVNTALSDLAAVIEAQSQPRRTTRMAGKTQAPETQAAAEQSAPKTDTVEPEPASVIVETPPAAGSPEALRAEYAEIAAIAAQAARLGVNVDAAEAMAKGITPDALRRAVLDTLAARAEASAVVAAVPAQSGAGDSPIVRRARERAAGQTS